MMSKKKSKEPQAALSESAKSNGSHETSKLSEEKQNTKEKQNTSKETPQVLREIPKVPREAPLPPVTSSEASTDKKQLWVTILIGVLVLGSVFYAVVQRRFLSRKYLTMEKSKDHLAETLALDFDPSHLKTLAQDSHNLHYTFKIEVQDPLPVIEKNEYYRNRVQEGKRFYAVDMALDLALLDKDKGSSDLVFTVILPDIVLDALFDPSSFAFGSNRFRPLTLNGTNPSVRAHFKVPVMAKDPDDLAKLLSKAPFYFYLSSEGQENYYLFPQEMIQVDVTPAARAEKSHSK